MSITVTITNRIVQVALILLVAAACRPPVEDAGAGSADPFSFGSAVSPDGAIPARQLVERAADYVGARIVAAGVIREICRPDSCWLSLDAGSGRWIRIVVRDSANEPVDMPFDVVGRWAFVDGMLESVASDTATETLVAAGATTALQLNAAGVQIVNPTAG